MSLVDMNGTNGKWLLSESRLLSIEGTNFLAVV